MTKKSNKIYIGLNASYHDPSIALVDEAGVIVYAQATERFTQNKRSLFTVADNYSFVESIIKSFSFKDYEIATNLNSENSLPGKKLSTVISCDSSQKYILLNRLIVLYFNTLIPIKQLERRRMRRDENGAYGKLNENCITIFKKYLFMDDV